MTAKTSGRAVAGIIAVWVSAYFLLLEPTDASSVGLSGQGPWRVSLEPEYRIPLEVVRWVFRPIHMLDRRVRRGVWYAEFDVNGNQVSPP